MNWYLIGLIIFLVCTLVAGIVIAYRAEDGLIFIVLMFVWLFAVCIYSGIMHDINAKTLKQKYINGCECGGVYEMTQAIGHADYTSYIYTCDICGDMFETKDLFNESIRKE